MRYSYSWMGLFLLAFLGGAGLIQAAEGPPGGMKLLPGYKHTPLRGIDSVVGLIEKEGGLKIQYEIGPVSLPGQPRFGGSFTDGAKNLPPAEAQWYQEQNVGGHPLHVALAKSGTLIVTRPLAGAQFHAAVKTPADVADVLLMVATFQPPAGK